MLEAILAILTILIVPPTQAPLTCVVSDGVNIAADLTTAQAGSRCLELPSGVFTVTPGTLLATADNLTIRGAGMGRTTLKLPDDLVINARTYVLRFVGAHQSISDLTIQGGLNATGTNAMLGISLENGATFTHVQRVEVVGLFGGNTAGASGIDLAQLWSGPAQRALIEDCIIRDGPNMTGIVVNSNSNTIRNNTIRDVGNTTQRHGIYIQGGYNLFDGNLIERVGGYSLHAWQKVQSIDGSGNAYTHNTSVDPGFQHMIVSGLASNGTNPAIPSGRMLTRTATITSNTFRNTGSIKRIGLLADVPAIISDNTFEDVVADGAQVIRVTSTAGGSIVRGNAIRAMSPASSNGGAVSIECACLAEGNSIDTRGLNYAITGGSVAGASVGPNLIYKSAP
jgi:hypothetical protein